MLLGEGAENNLSRALALALVRARVLVLARGRSPKIEKGEGLGDPLEEREGTLLEKYHRMWEGARIFWMLLTPLESLHPLVPLEDLVLYLAIAREVETKPMVPTVVPFHSMKEAFLANVEDRARRELGGLLEEKKKEMPWKWRRGRMRVDIREGVEV